MHPINEWGNMRIRYIQNAFAIIGLGTVLYFAVTFALVLFDTEGVVLDGDYRGISIGSAKSEIATSLTSASWLKGRLKVVGYLDPVSEDMVSIVFGKSQSDLIDSNVWYLAYSSFYRERIELKFVNNKVSRIRYTRNLFDP